MSAAMSRFFGVIAQPRTWLNVVYHWLAFPLGLFYFVFLDGRALGGRSASSSSGSASQFFSSSSAPGGSSRPSSEFRLEQSARRRRGAVAARRGSSTTASGRSSGALHAAARPGWTSSSWWPSCRSVSSRTCSPSSPSRLRRGSSAMPFFWYFDVPTEDGTGSRLSGSRFWPYRSASSRSSRGCTS